MVVAGPWLDPISQESRFGLDPIEAETREREREARVRWWRTVEQRGPAGGGSKPRWWPAFLWFGSAKERREERRARERERDVLE